MFFNRSSKWKQYIVSINEQKFSYWSNKAQSPQKTILLLAPGASNGHFFKNFAKFLPKNWLLIAPDYPGRGKSDEIKQFDTPRNIAKHILSLLDHLEVKDYSILAASFGTMMTTEIIINANNKPNEVFLVAPGEFLNKLEDKVMHTVFAPAGYSQMARKIFRVMVNKLNILDRLPDRHLESIYEQWVSSLDYKVPDRFSTSIPATIVRFKKDQIIPEDSQEKLIKAYHNHQILEIDKGHLEGIEMLRKNKERILESIFKLK